MPVPNYHLYRQPVQRPEPISLLYATELPQIIREAGHYHHLHRHPQLYQLTYVTGGGGTHWIEDQPIELSMGTTYLLAPGVAHVCESIDLKGEFLLFSPDQLPRDWSFSAHRGYRVNIVSNSDRALIFELFKLIRRERTTRPRAARHALGLLLNRISPVTTTVLPRRQLANEFSVMAQIHFTTHRGLDWYADRLSVSPRQLRTCVRVQFGKTPTQVLHDLIMDDARLLLKMTDKDVSEIAAELGFVKHGYFWRFFRRRAGTTPLAYRKGTKVRK